MSTRKENPPGGPLGDHTDLSDMLSPETRRRVEQFQASHPAGLPKPERVVSAEKPVEEILLRPRRPHRIGEVFERRQAKRAVTTSNGVHAAPESIPVVKMQTKKARRIEPVVVDEALVKIVARKIYRLSSGRLEVLKLIADGLKNFQIAEKLGIGQSAVENRISVMCRRLGIAKLEKKVKRETLVQAYKRFVETSKQTSPNPEKPATQEATTTEKPTVTERHRAAKAGQGPLVSLRELSDTVAQMRKIGMTIADILPQFGEAINPDNQTWVSRLFCLQRLTEDVWALFGELERRGEHPTLGRAYLLSTFKPDDQLPHAKKFFDSQAGPQ